MLFKHPRLQSYADSVAALGWKCRSARHTNPCKSFIPKKKSLYSTTQALRSETDLKPTVIFLKSAAHTLFIKKRSSLRMCMNMQRESDPSWRSSLIRFHGDNSK